ncbi:MAG: sugar phosphate isomerase/epimerase [Flavobacteriaceae bacterium TMED120]|nr:MAG: sugar phosphate isomerase/epimerase [Flavobacteriaceae bacterium TMED120]
MEQSKYPFLHTISGLQELIDAIDSDNVGYLLDSFHSYCAKDEKKDLDFLQLKDIVAVQINDGVLNRNPDTQLDQERELPGDSGLIDLRSFLNLLQSKGYVGPVSVEPFNRSINKMEDLPKLKRVRRSLQKFGI